MSQAGSSGSGGSSTLAIETIDLDTGSISPVSNTVTLNGDGLNISTSGSGSTGAIALASTLTINTIEATATSSTVNLYDTLSTGSVTLGNNSSSSTTTIKAGSGNINLAGNTVSQLMSNSGNQVYTNITNSSNTTSSSAAVQINVGGAAAGDPTIRWNITGVQLWTMGINNGDSDSFKLATGSNLTSSTVFRVDAVSKKTIFYAGVTLNSGDLTLTTGNSVAPQMPAFGANVSTTIANVTGDGTYYEILFDTATFDQGSNFNTSTGKFGAPVNGIYQFNCNIWIDSITSSYTAATILFSVNNGTTVFQGPLMNPTTATATNYLALSSSATLKLSVGDTVGVTVAVTGGAKTVGVLGSGNDTIFNGFLVNGI